jgi:hypothetical protein
MPTLKTYRNPEMAYIDAGYLCSMGIDAMVGQDPAYGGALFGASEAPHRLEVPESQQEQAVALLARRPLETPAPAQTIDEPLDTAWLPRFFRFILIYDTICLMVICLFARLIVPEPPVEVADFLRSLAFSEELWFLSYVSFWPLMVLGALSNMLCYFYQPLGRTLFVLTIIWSLMMRLGPPPAILSPYYEFFGGIQGTLYSMALALMYWSPLRAKFARQGR